MTSKQRAYLRSLAMTMTPIVNIGKNGVTDSVTSEVDNLLEVAECLATEVNAIVVQTVGSKITLYRVSKKDDIKHIELPQ